MAITLNDKVKATSPVEKLFIEAGGYDPNKTLNKSELSDALQTTITRLADIESPALLKIYQQCVDSGDISEDAEISALANTLV